MSFVIQKAGIHQQSLGLVVVVYGGAGVGKTFFSCGCFPKPIVIPFEYGLRCAPWVDTYPQPYTAKQGIEMIDDFLSKVQSGESKNKTLVLDSISKYDLMVEKDLCVEGQVANLNKYGGGYGAGSIARRFKHQDLYEKCEDVLNLGINVVAISHAQINTINPPDGDSYDQWTLQMSDKSRDQWINNSDAVIHIRAPLIRDSADVPVGKKDAAGGRTVAKDGGNYRIVDMTPKAATTSKNRFRVNEELYFSFDPVTQKFNNPIAEIFGFEFEQKENAG